MVVLYDMAMAVGGEVKLGALLTRTLQRLLYHTAFPVGLALLDLHPAEGGTVRGRLHMAIGDHALGAAVGRELELPTELVVGEAVLREDPALLARIPAASGRYTAYLRLPVAGQGVILLLGAFLPRSELPLAQLFMPIMANLGRAIVLCRDHEAYTEGLVAERDTARQRLEESAETLQAMGDAALDAIVACDAEGRISYWNPAAARAFGWSAEEVIGKDLHAVLAPERYREEAQAAFRRFRESGQGAALGRTREVEALRKDGREIPVEVALSALTRTGKGAALGILRDVSERKQIEERLRRSQKLDALGQLAGGVAHDFNNLLVVINGYTELAAEALPLGAPLRADIEQIRLAGQKASVLTRQLLAFGRKQVLKPAVLALNDVVKGLEEMLRRVIGEDVRLRTELAPDLGNVLADSSQVEQILLNLVANARDAMPGGGTLLIETSNAEIDAEQVRAHAEAKPGSYVVLAVSDTGCGMAPQTMARMFEPFFSTKPSGKGTGLGLSTVYGIVRQSGGHVDVRSEVGRGSTFRIYLPRVRAEVQTAAPAPAAAVARGAETVLVAEDDPGVRRLAERVLSPLGYRVLCAATAEEALAIGETHPEPIDLLLTDVVMPGMDGAALAERLVKRRRGLAVIYMSGHSVTLLAHHGGIAPDARFIEKPFTPSELGRKVREALNGAPR
jgi:PAS domain S-box-containing protein